MNRLIILFAPLYFFTSCEPTLNTSSEYWKSLVNETDKVFFYIAHSTAGSDSAFAYGNDSIGFYFAIHETVTLPLIGPYHIDIDRVFPLEEKLYNLTDTSSFLHVGPYYSGNWRDSLYRTYISCNREGSSFNNNKYMETLVITDTLISTMIMQKDYTMLDKFKEYYAHE
jgi:hypothetical protein